MTALETTMRAVVQDRYGDDPREVFAEATVERPTPGPGQVLIRVAGAGVDRGTLHLLTGRPLIARLALGLRRPKWRVPGRDVAGTVVAVGADVEAFAVGDEVHGTVDGSFAEYAAGEVGRLAPKPARLSFPEAAAVPVSGLTAIQAVRDRARVQAGERVLVLGASGGVGSYAVQIAKAYGAEVTGVARTEKLEFVRGLGADHVVDHTVEDVLGSDVAYDAIIDIAGNHPVRRLRRLLTPEGRLVIVGGETDGPLLGGLHRQLTVLVLSPFVRHGLSTFVSSENGADLRDLDELIEAGQVTPAVDRVLPLEGAAEAVQLIADGSVRGKLALEV